MSPVRRPKHVTPTHVVDAEGDVLEVGDHCGIYIDLAPSDQAPAIGDWIATEAGSRYLVDQVHVVRRRSPVLAVRYRLRTFRLPKHAPPPDDVRVIWLQWYPRGSRR